MRQIYKILISSFAILILTSIIVNAAKPPNSEQVQDTRLTNLEVNDTLQQINNTEQQGLINDLINNINSLSDQISQLVNRVTNLENNPYPAIYTKFDQNLRHVNRTMTNGCCNDYDYTEVTSYTFYLPKTANVIIESSGQFYGLPGIGFYISMGVDDDFNNAWRGYTFTQKISSDDLQSNFPPDTGFQISKGYYLPAGYHTIRLKGIEWAYGYPEYTCTGQGECAPWMGEIYISVIATDPNKGDFQQDSITNLPVSQEMPDKIKVTINNGKKMINK